MPKNIRDTKLLLTIMIVLTTIEVIALWFVKGIFGCKILFAGSTFSIVFLVRLAIIEKLIKESSALTRPTFICLALFVATLAMSILGIFTEKLVVGVITLVMHIASYLVCILLLRE